LRDEAFLADDRPMRSSIARRSIFLAAGAAAALAAAVYAARLGRGYYRLSHPQPMHLSLPAGDVAASSPAGERLFAESLHADEPGLEASFQSQEKLSWCGVATAVTVLGARGEHVSQDGFFTPRTEAVRSWWKTTFGGMTLGDLAGMLAAHGATTTVHYASDETVDSFRTALAANLATQGDWLVVNYDRAKAGEKGGGHISPIAAYDPAAGMVLLLDVAAYKYPPHWVDVARLFAAMDTPDSESHRSRGWLEVR
jgi:hypothetical protein